MIVNFECRYDCDIFVIQYMELWNSATMRNAIEKDKVNYYRLKVVCELTMHEANKE